MVQGAEGAAPCHFGVPHLVHMWVIDRFYKGAISNVEVEKFWGILPGSVATVTSWRRSLVASVG
jgi:hypothetical protein